MELQFDFADAALRWLTSSGLTIVVVLILTLVAAGIAGILTNRLRDMIKDRVDSEERQKRINTLFAIVRTTVRAVLLVLGCIMILSELGVDLAPILATVGILGLAVSFGAQSLVKDIISGIFILIENRIRVGDVIKVDSVAGLVESINIRTIILRDLQGQMHVVPNGKVEVFSNLTKEFSRSVLDIGVSYREDVDRVMDVLRELAE
jgi:moderate conductance mechanosensitive channel